jgi:alpha-N-arabinofuranosidase
MWNPRPDALASLCGGGEKNDTVEIIIKVVNITGKPQASTINLNGAPTNMSVTATVLTSTNPSDGNNFENPKNVVPRDFDLGNVISPFNYSFMPYSVTVLCLKP